jgi:OOP family OmpA-OmpF porin
VIILAAAVIGQRAAGLCTPVPAIDDNTRARHMMARRYSIQENPYSMRKTAMLRAFAALALTLSTPQAYAQAGRFYDPSNAASTTGFTVGHELFRTIGCPGRELLGVPCTVADQDGDGVPDTQDKCPAVAARTADGCLAAAPVEMAPVPPVSEPVAPPVPTALAVMPSAFVLTGVTFDNDQASLRSDAIAILDRAAFTLQQWGNVKVEVAGHTDSWSDDAHNLNLSQRRAETVRAYLVSRGVAADRLSARGYGESRPIADNATEIGRAQNRRVELVPLR